MCGATKQQKQISDTQQQFYTDLTNHYNTIFGQNQAITGALTSQFLPILQAGPTQAGFAQPYETALRTQAGETTATNYAQAQRATAQALAARGGGNAFLPSSVNANIIAANTAAAAATTAQAQNQITQANYQQGYSNWQQAANALAGTAGILNPTAYSGQATGAGSAAATTATQIAQANFAPWGAVIGTAGSVLGGKVGSSLLAKVPGMGGSSG